MSDQPERCELREQLRALIAEFGRQDHGEIDDDTPLISSALLESTTLLNVALWVEEHIDAAVEVTSFDLASEWETVARILDFVEKHRRRDDALPPSRA
jgi:acyl carrier protein